MLSASFLSRLIVCCLFVVGCCAEIAHAGEWPQILGPDRNGIAEDEKWLTDDRNISAEKSWSIPVGSGVAGAAIQSGKVILTHRQEDQELVEAYRLTDGKRLWSQAFPTTFQPRVMPDDGPLCVPTISGAYVIVYGASGGLRCLEFKTGKVVWTRETHQEYSADEGYFGAGSSPVVVGKLVLVNVGGFRNDAGVVAFDLQTGKTAWQTGAWQPSYSAPVLAKIGEKQIVVFCTRLDTIGLDPESGKVLFETPFGMRGPTVNGATPLVWENHLFLTASYGIGNVWAKFDEKSLTVLRSDQSPIASQYTTPIRYNKSLFGIDGRQDGPPADLICFDPVTGEERWRESSFGYATIIRVNKQMLLMKTDGELVIVGIDEKQYQEHKRLSLLAGTTRALPALSNGYLVLRNEQEFACFQLSSKPGTEE